MVPEVVIVPPVIPLLVAIEETVPTAELRTPGPKLPDASVVTIRVPVPANEGMSTPPVLPNDNILAVTPSVPIASIAGPFGDILTTALVEPGLATASSSAIHNCLLPLRFTPAIKATPLAELPDW